MGTKRVAVSAVLMLVSSSAAAQFGPQEWPADQDGMNNACYNVSSFSANNLTPGGQAFSIRGSGEIVNGPNPYQSQLAWSVDPQSLVNPCSDSNSGLTDSVPLCSMAELARRVYGSTYPNGVSCVVRLLSSMQTTDQAFFQVSGTGTPGGTSVTPFGFNSFFTIVGVPVVSYTGTIASPSQTAQGGVGDNHFTDTGAPAFSTSSKVWHDVTAGGYFWPQKDLGSHVYRVSRPVKNFQNGATLANGDMWQILSLPAINNLTFPSRIDGENQYEIALVHEASTTAQNGAPIRWSNVQFDTAASSVAIGTLNNCRDFFRTFYANRPVYVSSGGLLSTATGQTLWDVAEQSSMLLNGGNVDYLSLQGIQIKASANTVFTGAGGTNTGANLMFYDLTTPGLAPTSSNSSAVLQSLGGLGNSGKLIDLEYSGDSVAFTSLPSGSVTSDASPYEVMGVSSATLPIQDSNSATLIALISDPAGFLGFGCVQSSAAGKLTATGSACGSGSGGVSSVAGTAQRISATPATGAVVVDTIGGFYSGAVSGGNEDLGTTLTNGLVCNDTTAGVAVLRSCVSGTDYQPATAKTCTGGQFLNEIDATGAAVCASPPAAGADALATYEVTSSSHIPANGVNLGALASGVNEQTTTAGVASPLTYQCVAGEVQFGAASGGGLAQSPNLFYATTGTLPQLGVGTSTPATGYSIDAKADATSGLVGLRLEVAGNTGNFNMAFDPITLGPYLVSHTDLANKSTLNAPGARLQFGGNGFIASASPATTIGAARTWNQGVQVNPSDGSVYFGLPAGHAVDVSMGSGIGTSDNHGFFFLETGNGPPTGTPAPVLGGNSWATYIDRANFRFDVYDATNSRWETWGQNDGALSGAPGIIKTAATTGIHSIAVAGTDYQAPLTACADYVSLTCVSGATDLGGSNATPTVIGIENDAAMRGDLLATAITAPSTPAAGKARVYIDSTSKNIAIKNDAGTVNHGMQSGSCFASGTWVNQLSDNGSFGCTKPGFSDLSGSLACIQRPAQLGDSTAPAGSCTTTNVAITETSGPQQLTFGAIPDSSPQSTVLIRPTGTNTVVGIAASLIADSVTKHDYFINEAVDAALYIGEWASTSNDNFIGTGITIEYPNDFKAGHIKGTMNLIATIGIVSAAITCSLTLNGVAITSGGLSFTPSVTANGLYTTGTIATGSASASDTYGLECSTSGSLLVGAQYDFSYQMVLTP